MPRAEYAADGARDYPTPAQLLALIAAGATCGGCGDALVVDVLEYWPDDRAFVLDTCCEGSHEDALHTMREWTRQDWAAWFPAVTGTPVRQVITDAECGRWVVDNGLQLAGVALEDARAFVAAHHRHNVAPRGWRWGHAAVNGGARVAVATVGQPVARGLDHRTVVEVTRLCVDATLEPGLVWNACSQLYGAAAREAQARGFQHVVTYTMADEAGTSLKAAGYRLVDSALRPVDVMNPADLQRARVRGKTWHTKSRPRVDQAPTCDKWRWARALAPTGRARAARAAQQAVRDAKNAAAKARAARPELDR
jgi:hypothetical protein